MKRQEKLLKMLHSDSFEGLDSYSNISLWKKMTEEEKDLLAILFLKRAEMEMNNRDNAVFKTIELATMLVPESVNLRFHKGMLFSRQSDNMRCLLAAAEGFKEALEIEPSFRQAWFAWGNVLYDMGCLSEDVNCFQQALEKYEKASLLIDENDHEFNQVLFWRWGSSIHCIGIASGEPGDFLNALEKFKKSQEYGNSLGMFYNNFGNVYSGLGNLLPQSNFSNEAVEYYRKATVASAEMYDGWFNLGCTLALRLQTSDNQDDFLDAHQAFEKCIEIDSSQAMAWVRWGHLLTFAGKITQDIDKVYASLYKYEAASLLEPEMPRLLLHWGEALLMVGEHEEKLDYLKDAEAKISKAMQSLHNAEEAWTIYGKCLCDLGNYFDDANYYKQALEKIEQALKLFPDNHVLLIGSGHAQVCLGDLTGSLDHYKEALNFFKKAWIKPQFFTPSDFNEWGVALMKLAENTLSPEYISNAVDKFEQAISLALQKVSLHQVDTSILYNYGVSLDFLAEFHNDVTLYEKAIQTLAHVVNTDEGHPFAKYNLALALYHRAEFLQDYESYQQALNLVDELVNADPEDDVLFNLYGTLLLSLGDILKEPEMQEQRILLFMQAEFRLKQAVVCGSIIAHYNLACLNALMGMQSQAIQHLLFAEKHGVLPSAEELLDEEWLESLHGLSEFRTIANRQFKEIDGNMFDDLI